MSTTSTCPNCQQTGNARFPGSDWCIACVELTLAEQEADMADTRSRPQVIRT